MSNFQTHTKILQHIFESSSQAILILNNEMIITKANLVAQSLFDFKENELENKFIETVIPELIKKINSDMNQYITGLWITKKDGSQSLISLQLNRISNEKSFDTVLFIVDNTDNLIYKWALEGSQKDLLNIESEGNLGNWYWVFETNERYWSDEFYRICGLPPGDNRLNAETALTFIHPDDRKMAIELVTQTVEKHIPYNIEKRIVRPDGTVRNVIARGNVDYNTKGEPVRLSGTMKDITILKHEQEALIESNRKHKTLINNLNGIVYSCKNDMGYSVSYISEGCYAITGYTSDEFLNGSINLGNIILEEDRIYVKNEINKALSQKKHFNIQYRIHCKKGTINYVRERGCGVYNDNGKHVSLEGFITDETEQKKTQEILEIRNRALEAAGSGIIIADALKPNLPIIYCNQSFTKITGYKESEVIGKNCKFLQNNDKDQPQIKTMSIALQEKKPCHVILRNYRKDGIQFWNDLTITPIKNKIGKTTHFIGIQNDITKQKNAEILKDDLRDILELIAEDANLSLVGNKIIKTIENQFPEFATIISIQNPKTNVLEKLLESKELKALSKKLNETDDSEETLFQTAFESNKKITITDVSSLKNLIDHKDLIVASGIKSCWSLPILSSKKKLLGRLSIFHKDEKNISKKNKETITDLIKLLKVAIEKNHIRTTLKQKEKELEAHANSLEKKIEERTQEVVSTIEQLVSTNLNLEDQIQITQVAEKSADVSRSLSLAIAKNFPNGFIVVFDDNFKIILKEGQAIKELGLDKVISEGMSIDDILILSKGQKTKLKKDVIRTLKREYLSFEIVYKKKYFSVNTTPLVDENDEIFTALFVYNNISQQKNMELVARKALSKEKELNELKSRFISMASHEFRTPLSAIQTSAILIAKLNEPGYEVKREKYVKQIDNNVKSLIIILNDFLSLSKLEAGKVTVNREFFDLVDFSKKMIEEIAITAKTGQSILFSSSRNKLSINLDPKLTHHILINLLSNAIKYSPENTKINLNIYEDEQFVTLSVKDKGIGIPKEEQKNLFERFFRGKNAQNIEGTGLGLNIAKHYAELMGGSIDFTSEPNNGTNFCVKWLKPTKE